MDHHPDPHCKRCNRHLTTPFQSRLFPHTRKELLLMTPYQAIVKATIENEGEVLATAHAMRVWSDAHAAGHYFLESAETAAVARAPHQTGAYLPFWILLIKFRNPEFNRQILGAIFQYYSSHFSSFPVKNKKRLHNTTASQTIFYE